jgi:cardiolipin synthase
MTIPNLLTLLRILLTPLLIWFLLDRRLTHALGIFLLAGLTDGLDGLIARVFHQKSRLGAYLDPLADKLLLVSSFLLLGRLGEIPSWLVVITVSRDAIILMGITVLLLNQVKLEIKPSGVSKLTTLAQLLTVFLVLSSAVVPVASWILAMLFAVTAVLSIASGIHYMLTGLRLWEAPR